MKKLRLLIIDDDEVDRMAFRRTLKQAEITADVDEASSKTTGMTLLRENVFDCVFLDYQLPDGDGLSLLHDLNIESIEAPVVMMTGQGNEELVVEMLHAGALDYLPKANMTPKNLARIVCNVKRVVKAEAANRSAQSSLAEIGARLQYLMDNSPAIIYGATPTGDFKITFVSENLRHVLGYEPQEILNDKNFWFEHVHLDDRVELMQCLPRLLTEGGQQSHDYRFRHRDGHYLWVQDRIRMICDEFGAPLELLGSLHDITERKAVEETILAEKETLDKTQQRLLEANRLKSEFVANMSHELRTPLNAIIGFASVLRKEIDGPLNDEQKNSVAFIENGGKQLLALINDVLDLSKIEAGHMELSIEPVTLLKLFSDVTATVTPLFKDKKLTLNLALENEPEFIEADATRLRQILLNLLSNAVKFTDTGFVTLSSRTVSKNMPGLEPNHRDRLLDDKQWLMVTVQDSGIGISPEDIPKVFEEFRQIDGSSTRRAGGTGLGMPISLRFVEMHSGQMWLESTPGKGTSVYFTLPIHRTIMNREVKDEPAP